MTSNYHPMLALLLHQVTCLQPDVVKRLVREAMGRSPVLKAAQGTFLDWEDEGGSIKANPFSITAGAIGQFHGRDPVATLIDIWAEPLARAMESMAITGFSGPMDITRNVWRGLIDEGNAVWAFNQEPLPDPKEFQRRFRDLIADPRTKEVMKDHRQWRCFLSPSMIDSYRDYLKTRSTVMGDFYVDVNTCQLFMYGIPLMPCESIEEVRHQGKLYSRGVLVKADNLAIGVSTHVPVKIKHSDRDAMELELSYKLAMALMDPAACIGLQGLTCEA